MSKNAKAQLALYHAEKQKGLLKASLERLDREEKLRGEPGEFSLTLEQKESIHTFRARHDERHGEEWEGRFSYTFTPKDKDVTVTCIACGEALTFLPY